MLLSLPTPAPRRSPPSVRTILSCEIRHCTSDTERHRDGKKRGRKGMQSTFSRIVKTGQRNKKKNKQTDKHSSTLGHDRTGSNRIKLIDITPPPALGSDGLVAFLFPVASTYIHTQACLIHRHRHRHRHDAGTGNNCRGDTEKISRRVGDAKRREARPGVRTGTGYALMERERKWQCMCKWRSVDEQFLTRHV